MLSEVAARRVSVGLSLFAAVCAGYLAGSRALTIHTIPVPSTPAPVASPSAPLAANFSPRRPHLEFRGAGVTAASKEASDKDRANALNDMLDLEVWRLSVTRVTPNHAIQCEWVLRETGKPDLLLTTLNIGTGIVYEGVMTGKTPVVARLLPIGDGLTNAKRLRLGVYGPSGGAETSIDNPFLGMNQWGTDSVGDSVPAGPKAGTRETEIPLMHAARHEDNFLKKTREVRLILILSTTK